MTRPRPHLPAHLSACPLFQRFAERCAYNYTHSHGPTQLTLKHLYMPPLHLLSSSFLDKRPLSRLPPAPAHFISIPRERRYDLSELQQSTALKPFNLAFEPALSRAAFDFSSHNALPLRPLSRLFEGPSVGSMVSECLKPKLSTTSKRNTRGSEFQRRGLHACKKR